MNTLILLFLAITVLWLCYWVVVRPIVLDSVDDQLRQLHSELDWAVIEDRSGARSEAAQHLVRVLQCSPAFRSMSLSPVVLIGRFKRVEIAAQWSKERALFEQAPHWIREMWVQRARLNLKATLANSPAWWGPLAILLLAGVFSQQVQNWWEQLAAATKASESDLNCPWPVTR